MLAAVTDGLRRAEPEALGVNSQDILRFIDDAKDSGVELNSFMIYRSGAVISEGWWWPYRPDLRHMMHSATKSFLSVAVGLAVHEGYFSLQDRVVSFFPDRIPKDADANLLRMTVEDLITQTSGHAQGTSGGTWRNITTSWIDEFFAIPVIHPPGTIFKYSSATSFMLSAIISQTTGQSARDFLETRLFQPLGIEDLTWDVGPENINSGGNGISCRSSDLLKLAILHLQKGVWDGRQVLPAEWVERATTSKGNNNYGYHWWTGPHGSYYAYGVFGQFAFVFPEQDGILVTTSAVSGGETALRALIWRHFPRLFASSTPLPTSRAHELASRLQNLRLLPNLSPVDSLQSPHVAGGVFVAGHNADTVQAFALDFSSDRCTFYLQDERGVHHVEVGLVDWLEAGGFWIDQGTFKMIWQFVETSFRDIAIIHFIHDKAILDRSVNINTFGTVRPSLTANMLRAGAEGKSLLEKLDCAANLAISIQLNTGSRFQPPMVYSTKKTSIRELLDNQATRVVLHKHIPTIMASSRPNSASAYTLDAIMMHTTELTPEVLLKIDNDLLKLPQAALPH
ncbi:beta-lactamase/transpeptidase-like protein [Xylogone sp. PMI_703]|nr:beta-lactamase/transpeptidase-like protein [Xylogone sp. PMI_703]